MFPTQADLDQRKAADAKIIEAETEKRAEKFAPVLELLCSIPKKGEAGELPCPKCGAQFHWRRAKFNGHLRGACVTQNCLSFIQ